MIAQNENSRTAELHAFSHPRYFYGQLLDVRHFESEHSYFQGKMWLLNRLIHGYGVVCGLDVRPGDDPGTVVVTPGVALDPWGREIIVPCESKPVRIEPLPDDPPTQDGGDPTPQLQQSYVRSKEPCEGWVHLAVCFQSRDCDPEPVLAGSCDASSRCAMGAVRESYCIPQPRPGQAARPDINGTLHEIYKCRPADYGELVEYVTRSCNPCLPCGDPCIVLANIRQPKTGGRVEEIDINVRPIVYNLDLLCNMILSTTGEPPKNRGGKNQSA